MGDELFVRLAALSVVAGPLLLLCVLGVCSLVDRPCSERLTVWLVSVAVLCGLLASVGVGAFMISQGTSHYLLDLGDWVAIDHYHFSVKLLFDTLSLPFVLLALVVCGTIGTFANRYLHREPGYNRFFVLYAFFIAGITLTALAGTIETLFAGWELVGLSSAFLVAFFHERPMPVRNGLRVWVVYRLSDAALLAAAILLHHATGVGDLDVLGAPGSVRSAAGGHHAWIVGTLLLISAAGKSALIPFSGWLPRAMEGPTPSSAVFYGAISVHLGAFLLLRVSPILDASPILSWSVVALGVGSAGFAALAGRVQTDIKSALSFASLTQVSIIVAEIGLGFRYLALAHLIGHACLRTLQFVRAPTLLHDYHTLENALGDHPAEAPSFWGRLVPERARTWWYRLALERGFFDPLLTDYVVLPFLRVFQWCDALERRWTALLSERQAERVRSPAASRDELS
jgi:NAD(P)H-quinone oxidoreductase subunit 5